MPDDVPSLEWLMSLPTTVLPERCGWHEPRRRIPGVPALEHIEERVARGEEQIRCDDCHRHFWPDEWGRNPNRSANL